MINNNKVLNLLESHSGYLSSSRMIRENLDKVAAEMVYEKKLLLGRSFKDGSYYFGLPSLKEEVFIDIRWLKQPLIRNKDCVKAMDAWKKKNR